MSEKKYRTLFETIDKGLCVIDLVFDEDDNPVDFLYLETNKGFEKYTGLKDVAGKKASDVLPNLEEDLIKIYAKVLKTGEPAFYESYFKSLKRWFEISAYRVGDSESGKIAVLFNDISERKQTEVNNALLSAIVKSSDDAIISKDLNSIITSWNDGAKRMFGYTVGEAVGRPITMLFPEDRLDEEEKIIDRIKKGERVEHFETVRKRKDGTLLDVSLTISPVKDSDGNIVGASKIARDITLRKEHELKDALLSAIVKSSDDAIISKDLNSIITSWNDGAKRMFGYTAGEAVGRPITMLFPEDRLDEEEEIIGRIQKGERVEHFETVRKHKDGSFLEVSLTVSPVKDSDGNIVGASKIARDITERKQTERKLRKNKNRLRTVLEIETVGVVFWGGDDFTITEVNDAFLKISGFNRNEVLGKDWRELTPKEFYSVSNKAVKDLKTIGHTKPYEKQYLRSDGSRWWGLSAPRRIDDNEVVEFLLDITERKEAEQELETVNENLEERVEERTASLLSYQDQLRALASQLSKAEEQERQRLATELHDNLGQMLTLGKMKVDLLEKKNVSDEVSNDIHKLQEILNDALTYTRKLMSDLKPPPSLEGEDLRASIRWIAKQMEKHDLKVTVTDDERPKPVDEEMRIILLQCIRELLFNIIKHTTEKEALINLVINEGELQISVTDDGEGFNPKKLELSPDQQGGFGLFNIQERIDLLGGGMDINSEMGRGTKITLYVPLEKKDQKVEPTGKTQINKQVREIGQKKQEDTRIKVLLVDDHQMVREGLRKIIDDHDDIVVIAEAADGEEAVNLARETSPHIILMDVNMPVMDGIEATRVIHEEMPDIRIIGLSLHDNEDVIADMRSAGATAYLTKTEALESLIVTVRTEASDPG